MQGVERERQRQFEERERQLRQEMSVAERKQFDERKRQEREKRRADKDKSKNSQNNVGDKSSGPTAYDVFWMRQRAEERRRRQDQLNCQRATQALGSEIASWKPTTRQILGTGIMFGGSAMLAAIAVPSQSETMQSITGIFVGSTLLMSNAIRIGARSKLADDPREFSGNLVTGDSHWLKTTSTMFGLTLGRVVVSYPSGDEALDTAMAEEMVLALGLQGAVRLSFVRLDWYTHYLASAADGQDWRGLDTGVGLGIQPFRGGLLSPYAVYRLAFFPNSIGEEHRVYDAAVGPNGSDIVIGNTFYFRELGYKGSRGKDTLYLGRPESSRFFLDVAYTLSGRQFHEGKVLISLGFDNAFSF